MFNKQTNIFLVCIDYFFKCEMGSERGADSDMYCTFHTSRWAMIWLLLRTQVLKFNVHTQSPVRTVNQKRMCSMCGVFVCVAYC